MRHSIPSQRSDAIDLGATHVYFFNFVRFEENNSVTELQGSTLFPKIIVYHPLKNFMIISYNDPLQYIDHNTQTRIMKSLFVDYATSY